MRYEGRCSGTLKTGKSVTLLPENVDSVMSSSEGLLEATPSYPTPLRIRLLGELDLRRRRRAAAARVGPGRVAARLPAAPPRGAPAAPAPGLPALARLDRAPGPDQPAPPAAQPAAGPPRPRPLPGGDPADAQVARRRPLWLDVAAFEGAVARAEDADPRRPRPCRRPSSCTAATCSRAATTSGCWRSGSGCASAISRPWSGWPSCWRPGRACTGDPVRRAAPARRTRCARRPTGS